MASTPSSEKQDEASSSESRYQHRNGVHFPADIDCKDNYPGYLLVDHLATTLNSVTLLVLSLEDFEIYVRKIERGFSDKTKDKVQATEVRNYVPHPSIPRLISFREYGDEHEVKTATIWQFCNGGMFATFLDKAKLPQTQDFIKICHPKMSLRIPEVFILRFLDTAMAVLIKMHSAGISHNDLHLGNILFHWSSKSRTLPEVLLSDFNLSVEYPLKSHPHWELKMPFRINSLDDVYQPQSSSSRKPASSKPHVSTLLATHNEFEEKKLVRFYNRCRGDWMCILNCLAELMTCPTGVELDTIIKIRRAAAHNKGIFGYSPELTRLVSDFDEAIQPHQKRFTPYNTMQRMIQLQRRTDKARQAAEKAFNESKTQEPNIFQLLRPAMPEPRPALWSSHEAVSRTNLNTGDITITSSTEPQWKIDLNYGHFVIRRLDLLGLDGHWGVVQYDEYSSDDDEGKGRTTSSKSDSDSDDEDVLNPKLLPPSPPGPFEKPRKQPDHVQLRQMRHKRPYIAIWPEDEENEDDFEVEVEYHADEKHVRKLKRSKMEVEGLVDEVKGLGI